MITLPPLVKECLFHALILDLLNSGTISQLDKFTKQFLAERTPTNMKQPIIQNMPRHTMLKPLQSKAKIGFKSFELGDCINIVAIMELCP
ncbi:uncharacterized protein VP01_2375g1 [Puccinia sorghi]|uniref:Uncharacterized protein n=1 Tax=Puccinia sorghi TaxID=27349 RepID=A0A0L6V8W6_9BASI|nr:uncharacterized protein VP01_2375g1 [Puccinia sorghi]